MKLDFSQYIDVMARFTVLGLFTAFVVGCALIWRLTYRISRGHDLIGRAVCVILFVSLLVLGLGPERLSLFRMLVYGSTSSWIYYNVWYFGKFPIPAEFLRALRIPTEPSLPVFVPRLAFLRYLMAEPTIPTHAWWLSRAFRNALFIAGGVFLLLYGFIQTINAYSWGYQKAAQERRSAEKQTQQVVKTAVNTAVANATVAISNQVKPLVQTQGALLRNQEVIIKGQASDRIVDQKYNQAAVRATKRQRRTQQIGPYVPVQPIQPKKEPVLEKKKGWWPFSLSQPARPHVIDTTQTELARMWPNQY